MLETDNMRMCACLFGSLLRVLNVVRNSYVNGWVGEACFLSLAFIALRNLNYFSSYVIG